MSFSAIPVLDVGGARGVEGPTEAFSATFTKVGHEVGFALVENHGISSELTSSVFEMMERFFGLSLSDKERIAKMQSPQFRGWEPVGAETTNNAADFREQIDVWTEWPITAAAPAYQRLLGPNQWLPDSVLEGHKELSMAWVDALAKLADQLMSALSVGLGLAPAHLRNLFGDQPMSLAKFIHYPPTPAGGAGVNPHHDTGFLTVLAPGVTPGLQVQNQTGDWIDVPIIADTFVINLGEILQAMTGNYLVATPHRVQTEVERYSTAYFHGPSLSTPLTRLPLANKYAAAVSASPHHHDAGFMPTAGQAREGHGAMTSDFRPNTYGEQLWNYFGRSYSKQMELHHST